MQPSRRRAHARRPSHCAGARRSLAARLPPGRLARMLSTWHLVADFCRLGHRHRLVLAAHPAYVRSPALGSCQRQERPRIPGERTDAEFDAIGSDGERDVMRIMPLTLELSPETESLLRQKAAQQGL